VLTPLQGGATYAKHSGLCLETQHVPASIGPLALETFGEMAIPILDSTNRRYEQTITYAFSA
jgi:hypothetical protein